MVWCSWQTAVPCQVNGLHSATQQGGVALIVCVSDEGSSRVTCRQEAWLSVCWGLCVCICVDRPENVAVAGAQPFHISQHGEAGKGYYAKSILVCAHVCVWKCLFVFIPMWEPSEALAGDSTLYAWLTASKPSLRRQSGFRAAKAVSLCLWVRVCASVCASHIFRL